MTESAPLATAYVVDVTCRDESHPTKVARITTFSRFPGTDRWSVYDPQRPSSLPEAAQVQQAVRGNDSVTGVYSRASLSCPLCGRNVTRRESDGQVREDRDPRKTLHDALNAVETGLRALGHERRGEATLALLAATFALLDRG